MKTVIYMECCRTKNGCKPFKCLSDYTENPAVSQQLVLRVHSVNTLQFWQQPCPFTDRCCLPAAELLQARSNLTSPLLPPQLHTQWTLPTMLCCQNTGQKANKWNKGDWLHNTHVYQLKHEANLTGAEQCDGQRFYFTCRDFSSVSPSSFLWAWRVKESNCDTDCTCDSTITHTDAPVVSILTTHLALNTTLSFLSFKMHKLLCYTNHWCRAEQAACSWFIQLFAWLKKTMKSARVTPNSEGVVREAKQWEKQERSCRSSDYSLQDHNKQSHRLTDSLPTYSG